jgi:hypothetical protein
MAMEKKLYLSSLLLVVFYLAPHVKCSRIEVFWEKKFMYQVNLGGGGGGWASWEFVFFNMLHFPLMMGEMINVF